MPSRVPAFPFAFCDQIAYFKVTLVLYEMCGLAGLLLCSEAIVSVKLQSWLDIAVTPGNVPGESEGGR